MIGWQHQLDWIIKRANHRAFYFTETPTGTSELWMASPLWIFDRCEQPHPVGLRKNRKEKKKW